MPNTRKGQTSRLRISLPPPEAGRFSTIPSSFSPPNSMTGAPNMSPHTPVGHPIPHPITYRHSTFRSQQKQSLRRRDSVESFGGMSMTSVTSDQSSLSGMSSLVLDTAEWVEDELHLLEKALDSLPQLIVSPYPGPIPPPGLLDRLAEAIYKDKEKPVPWLHNFASTRAKLLEVAQARATEEKKETEAHHRRLRRSDSMDFLNVMSREESQARAHQTSQRLQTINSIVPETFRSRGRGRSIASRAAARSNVTLPDLTGEPLPPPPIIIPSSFATPMTGRLTFTTRTDPQQPRAAASTPIRPTNIRRTESAHALLVSGPSDIRSLRGLKRAPEYAPADPSHLDATPRPNKRSRPNPTPSSSRSRSNHKSSTRKRRPSFIGDPIPAMQPTLLWDSPAEPQIRHCPHPQAGLQLSSPITFSTPSAVPQTPLRRGRAGTLLASATSTPAPTPVSTLSSPERIRTRSQTKADADAHAAAVLDREEQKRLEELADQNKENASPHSSQERERRRLRALKRPLDSPFDEKKKYLA